LDDGLEDKLTPDEIEVRVQKVLDEFPPKVDHPSLVEEMLMAFQQIKEEPEHLTSPLGDVPGQSDDEAGEPDED
jgi:hypothetical protein